MHIKLLGFVSILLIFACGKEKPKPQPPVEVTENKVLITNEGNFLYGNASISIYNKIEGTIRQDIFSDVNQIPLGDVCQSLYVGEGKIYIVVNNSGKVEVVNKNDFKKVGTIGNMQSPRYFLPISGEKAYVTELYQNQIHVLNLASNQKTGNIPLQGWTENLEKVGSKVFVTNKTTSKIYVINSNTDAIEDSLQLANDPNSLVKDKNGKLWVLCGGSSSLNQNAALYRLNPMNNVVELEITFPNLSDRPSKLTLNGGGDTLYFYKNGVFRFPISAPTLPESPVVQASWGNFYGLGIDPTNGDIYISDALDFVQRGRISRYKNNGNLHSTFLAGIIPGGFYFP